MLPKHDAELSGAEQSKGVVRIKDDPYYLNSIQQVKDAIEKADACTDSNILDDWNNLQKAALRLLGIYNHVYKSPEELRSELDKEVALASSNLEKAKRHLENHDEDQIEAITSILEKEEFNETMSKIESLIKPLEEGTQRSLEDNVQNRWVLPK